MADIGGGDKGPLTVDRGGTEIFLRLRVDGDAVNNVEVVTKDDILASDAVVDGGKEATEGLTDPDETIGPGSDFSTPPETNDLSAVSPDDEETAAAEERVLGYRRKKLPVKAVPGASAKDLRD